MNIFRTQLADALREYRGDMTQRVFARKVGLNQASVNRIEQGEQNITLDTLQQLCKRLKCTPNDLLMKK